MLEKELFEKEIALCRKMYKKQRGCNWGMCDACGVLPLLVKLCEGKMIEGEEEVKTLKRGIFAN